MRAIVVIVAKAPVPDCVKTRLRPHLSADEAARLYTLFVQDMIEEITSLTQSANSPPSCSEVAVAYTPNGAEAVFKTILPGGVPLFPQQGTDLGERLASIFEDLYDRGYDQVHIINSDSPDMPRHLIGRSIQLLENPHIDLVLGPCRDGGYYLIGLKKPVPQLFNNIPWSTDGVLAATLQSARELGLGSALLEPWYDIDRYEDLLYFLERNRNIPDDAHRPGWRTLRYLRKQR
jgi:uncharacterized protein